MKGMRFSEEQIIKVLLEASSGFQVADVCRKYGVSARSMLGKIQA